MFWKVFWLNSIFPNLDRNPLMMIIYIMLSFITAMLHKLFFTLMTDNWLFLMPPFFLASDIIWNKASCSTLVKEVGFCLMTPSHYLNPCWLIQWNIDKKKINIFLNKMQLKLWSAKCSSLCSGLNILCVAIYITLYTVECCCNAI